MCIFIEGNPPLFRLYADISVHCPNIYKLDAHSSHLQEKCEWFGSLYDLRRHLSHECLNEMENCPDCGKSYRRADREEHNRVSAQTHHLIMMKVNEEKLKIQEESTNLFNIIENSIKEEFAGKFDCILKLLAKQQLDVQEINKVILTSSERTETPDPKRRRFNKVDSDEHSTDPKWIVNSPFVMPLKGPVDATVRLSGAANWLLKREAFAVETPPLFKSVHNSIPGIHLSLQSDGGGDLRVAIFAEKGDLRKFSIKFSLSLHVIPSLQFDSNFLPLTSSIATVESDSEFIFSSSESRFLIISIPQNISTSPAAHPLEFIDEPTPNVSVNSYAHLMQQPTLQIYLSISKLYYQTLEMAPLYHCSISNKDHTTCTSEAAVDLSDGSYSEDDLDQEQEENHAAFDQHEMAPVIGSSSSEGSTSTHHADNNQHVNLIQGSGGVMTVSGGIAHSTLTVSRPLPIHPRSFILNNSRRHRHQQQQEDHIMQHQDFEVHDGLASSNGYNSVFRGSTELQDERKKPIDGISSAKSQNSAQNKNANSCYNCLVSHALIY